MRKRSKGLIVGLEGFRGKKDTSNGGFFFWFRFQMCVCDLLDKIPRFLKLFDRYCEVISHMTMPLTNKTQLVTPACNLDIRSYSPLQEIMCVHDYGSDRSCRRTSMKVRIVLR